MREAFRRLDGKSEQGVFVLSQAMGGGKTHNMIALGLLARNPELRKKVMGDLYDAREPKAVRVIAFTGRESDVPYGIWGAIADQAGKKEAFNSYYSPLQAPGQTAWVNLLKGEPTLILLDELPPYLENAKSKTIAIPISRRSPRQRSQIFWLPSERISFRTFVSSSRTLRRPTRAEPSRSTRRCPIFSLKSAEAR
jgi:hypothetical protein